MLAAHDHLAAVGMVQAADQVQNGGLARARRAHQRDKFPFRDFQVQAVQDLNQFLATAVIFDHLTQ